MIWTRRVALNGIQLDEAHDAVVIRSVEPGDGKESISAVSTAAGFGQRVTSMRRDMVDIIVRFAIKIRKNEQAERSAALEAVNAWAAIASEGAWMTVNYKPNRRLWVVLAQAPGEGSLWDYTKEFQITFRAYAVPYWEEETETGVTSGTDSSGTMSITVTGSAKTNADVTVTNKSGKPISSVTVTIAGKTMTFNGINLGADQKLVIDHLLTGHVYCIRARIGTASVLSYRTGADDFILSPGVNDITFSASRSVEVSVSARGRYL